MKVRSSEFGVRNEERSRQQLRTPNSQFRIPHGFTFVELLVAAVMVSILFVGLSAHLRQGLMAWQRVSQFSDMRQRERVITDQLERDLANAVIINTNASAYGTAPGMLPLPRFEADRLAWYTLRRTGGRERASVAFVTYECHTEGGVAWLRRVTQTLDQARGGTGEPASDLLAPACDALIARYAYLPDPASGSSALEWHSQWPKPPGDALTLPPLVDITIRFEAVEGTDGAATRMRAIRRTCAVPLGNLEPFR